MWQLLLVAWTYNQASNAARVASRVEAAAATRRRPAVQALSPGLRKHARVKGVTAERYDVTVRVPSCSCRASPRRTWRSRAARTLPG